DRANAAMAAREYNDARRYAEEAEADAKLAATTARSVKAQRAVAELDLGIRALKEELPRVPRCPTTFRQRRIMNAHRTGFPKTTIALALAVAALSACATLDQRPYALEDARVAVDTARANPQVTALAPGELNDAIAAYQRAESTYRAEGDSVEVRHLAYVARDRAAIAQEDATLRRAEQSIANATAERDRVRLMARTAEAENPTPAGHLGQLG